MSYILGLRVLALLFGEIAYKKVLKKECQIVNIPSICLQLLVPLNIPRI